MKLGRRAIALLLALIMMLACIPAGAEGTQPENASAPAQGVQGTTDVNTDGEELSFGEWLYHLDGDDAIISGYANQSESSLKVPYSLNGHPVTGISEGAFTGHSALQKITLHSYITQIANNAFGKQTRILAYGGSYALDYAGKHGLSKTNLTNSHGSIYVFRENVIDFDGFPEKDYTVHGYESITVSRQLASRISAGSLIYVPKKSSGNEIYAASVASVQNQGNTSTLYLAVPDGIGLVLESTCLDNIPLTMDAEHIRPYEGVELGQTEQSRTKDINGKFSKTRSLNLNIKFTSWLTLKGSLSLSVSASLSARFHYGLQWGWPPVDVGLDYIDLTLEPSFKASLKLEAQAKLRDKDLEKPVVDIPFNTPIPGLLVSVTLKSRVTLSGSVEFSFEVKDTLKLRYANGKLEPSNKLSVIGPSLNGAVELRYSVPFEVSGKLGMSLLGYEVSVKLISFETGPSLSLKAETKDVLNSYPCLDVTFGKEWYVSGKFGLIEIKYGSKTKMLSLYRELKKSWSFGTNVLHFDTDERGLSSIRRVDVCRAKGRTVIYKNGGSTYYTTTADAGNKLKPPADPKKDGYKFKGWQLNTKASGLRKKFNADLVDWYFKDRIPYIDDNTSSYTFEAKWEKLPDKSTVTNPPAPPTATPHGNTPGPGQTATPTPTATPKPTATPTPTPTPIPVSSVTLDKHELALRNEEGHDKGVLTATVVPANAGDTSVFWSSSNENVAYVDKDGNVTAMGPGTATITCKSNSNPNAKDTCAVTVIQPVTLIFLDAGRDKMLPGETMQVTATVFPSNASNKNITWSTSNSAVATVSPSGLITAKGYGTAVITASAQDDSGTTSSFSVTVERELELEVDQIYDTVYSNGEQGVAFAYVRMTNTSAERMARAGYTPVWSLTPEDNCTGLSEMNTQVTGQNGTKIDTSFAALNYSDDGSTTGAKTYTVTCTAGQYTATAQVQLEIAGSEYAESVTLAQTTFTMPVNEEAVIPETPVATDNKPLPEDLRLSLEGDGPFVSHIRERATEEGTAVAFDESGVYTGYAVYSTANLRYTVPITFYIQDENGIVHIPVSEVAVDPSSADLLIGQSIVLTAEVYPEDAYNKEVIWSSADESIARVNSEGKVTAVGQGMTYIICEAADGSGHTAACVISAEPVLALDSREIDLTIGMDGLEHIQLDTVNLTYESCVRLNDMNLRPTWTLTRNSGENTEIALSEYESHLDNGNTVYGTGIELLRMKTAGTDTFTLTCAAGEYSASCTIRIRTEQSLSLPTTVTANTSLYEAQTGEKITIDYGYTCTPANSTLPEDTEIRLDLPARTTDALTDDNFSLETLTFEREGEYRATLLLQGTNYRYECPVTFRISDENGQVPEQITEITSTPEVLRLYEGETAQLTASALPANLSHGAYTWSSLNTSVATVSQNGLVTAIGAGNTLILISLAETDELGVCAVFVEDGITFETTEITTDIYLDGEVRREIGRAWLTEPTSLRMTEAPVWTLTRTGGNNLTLKPVPVETVNASGQKVYGCALQLYSVSRTGETTYELNCTYNGETATIPVTVRAYERAANVPATIMMGQTVFEADVNELIMIQPEITCFPQGTQLPLGTRVRLKCDTQTLEAMNQQELYVSQRLTAVSFTEAGRYDAEFVYSYSNLTYTIPVTFRIRDAQGNVPVHAREIRLNYRNLNLTVGEEATLKAVFTPADATTQDIVWSSTDSSVVTVDQTGKVKARANGTAQIICTPADGNAQAVQCPVTVEDYMTADTGIISTYLYIQGYEESSPFYAMLSEGTMERLKRDGLTPEWSLTRNGTHADISQVVSANGQRIDLTVSGLTSAGTDTYTVRCEAGSHSIEQVYTLEVINLSSTAPDSISITQSRVNAAVGQAVTIDFTPVITPSGASIPSGMRSSYVGVGDFYDATDGSFDYDGNTVQATFSKAGKYLLVRRYILRNLQYAIPCIITVGQPESDSLNLLGATETAFTVYNNGTSGTVSTVFLKDAAIENLWGDNISWSISPISGGHMTAALKKNGNSVDVFIVNVESPGTDVWRVTCTFGGIEEYIDITLTAADTRKPIPESIALAENRITGTIGNMLYIPLGVSCMPEGSALPEKGDDFWSFAFDGYGKDRSLQRIEDGMLKVSFSESGYYTGKLTYRTGNVHFTLPVYFTIKDEEDVIREPELNMFLLNETGTVYPEGETGVVIAQAVMAEELSTYNTGAAVAYMNGQEAAWTLTPAAGSPVTLNFRKKSDNVYDVVLTGFTGTGDTQYTVKCSIGGKNYTATGNIHVAGPEEDRPDPTFGQTVYRGVVGEKMEIERTLYDRKTGAALQASILQSSAGWDSSDLLSAVGYEVEETDNTWVFTPYEEGTYTLSAEGTAGNLKVGALLTVDVKKNKDDHRMKWLKLPESLTEIGEEAFEGAAMDIIDIRGTAVRKIGKRAFANCTNLKEIYIPGGVTTIADDAFYGCLHITIICERNSKADQFAQAHHIPVRYQ